MHEKKISFFVMSWKFDDYVVSHLATKLITKAGQNLIICILNNGGDYYGINRVINRGNGVENFGNFGSKSKICVEVHN